MSGTMDVAGLRMVERDPRILRPNPWNPNQMDPDTFAKERRSIRTHGFVDPVTIREAPDGAEEIVDGEHRTRAAVEEALPLIPCVHLGAISDAQAKRLTILYNDLRGQSDSIKLAKVIESLAQETPVSELAVELPYTENEIEMLRASMREFDWRTEQQERAAADKGPLIGAQQVAQDERRFMVAGSGSAMTGHIPATLGDALLEQFYASGKALGSANLQLVLEDVVERLRRAESQAVPREGSRPLAPPTPRRGRKAAAAPAAPPGEAVQGVPPPAGGVLAEAPPAGGREPGESLAGAPRGRRRRAAGGAA